MRSAFSNVLGHHEEEAGVDRILEAGFFRSRPRVESSSSVVVHLADRRKATARDTQTVTEGFLVRGGRRR